MSTLTLTQQRKRQRAEQAIRLMAPALDAVLAVGERVSRVLEPEDYESYPVPPLGSGGRSPVGGDPEGASLLGE